MPFLTVRVSRFALLAIEATDLPLSWYSSHFLSSVIGIIFGILRLPLDKAIVRMITPTTTFYMYCNVLSRSYQITFYDLCNPYNWSHGRYRSAVYTQIH